MSAEELREKIAAYRERMERYIKDGRDENAEDVWSEVQKLERKLAKEEAKLPSHPASVLDGCHDHSAQVAHVSTDSSSDL
jgi:hypothetical protein